MAATVFTGLVQATGQLRVLQPRASGFRLKVGAPFPDLVLGESIAVNGVCLTVVDLGRDEFDADLSAETAERTTLPRLRPGMSVNLERALTLADRLGGHLVSGHVDAVTRVLSIRLNGEESGVTLFLPAELRGFVAKKGSVALDGVSLTVNQVDAACFDVAVIPHTQRSTTLSDLQVGRELNLEVDLVARYVARWLGIASLGAQHDQDGPLGSVDDRFRQALERAGML